jgi:ubiquinone/menaquinone biosynthesis C-methylase UbiE
MKKIFCGNEMDRMPDWAFRIMAFMFQIADFFKSSNSKLDSFNIRNGQTIIDYGSGTGRYLRRASELAGENGRVFAVDIHELAIKSAVHVINKYKLENVRPLLTDGQTLNLPSHIADTIYALDMFHMVSNPNGFLQELHRLIKPGGILYLEDGHQPRSLTREKIMNSGSWEIQEETKTFIKCKPKE